jgi:hypothetical protein
VSAPVLDGALDDGRNVGDAAAADADGHAGAGPKPRGEAALFELPPRFCPHIGQTPVRKILANDEQARRKHQVSSGEPTMSFISNQ